MPRAGMEPFVTRIGDVTIERVVPRANKEPRDSIPVPSVSLAKRGSDEDGIGDGISVSDDLQIFLKPPLHDSIETKSLLDNGTREGLSNVRKRQAKLSTDDEGSEEESDLENEQSSKSVHDNSDSESESDSRVKANQTEKGVRNESSVQREGKVEHQASTMAGDPSGLGDGIVSKEKEQCEVASSQASPEKSESNKRKAEINSSAILMKKKAKLSGKDAPDTKMETNKSSSSSDSDDAMEDHNKPAMERKVSNLRRNIREVMNESQLDEETLAAQRQEMERLRRVQEQQRIIREVQRQIALNRQNTKTQTRVISLLQGNSSILKQVPGTSGSSSSQVRLPNTVLVKLASSSSSAPNTSAQNNKKVFELLRVQKGTTGRGSSPVGRSSGSVRAMLGKARTPGQVHMMTPSVSIAPVMSSVRNTEPPSESESEGEQGSDKDAMALAALKKVGGKPKGKDVVTISSSSDDDDCILLSEPSSGDEADPVDDPTNSGMHTNDLYNVPDEQGRVLVNVGHPPEEEDIFLAPQIARVIKPHQIGGVRFLYDNVVETIERFNTSTGFGCILAHSMGLGKTLQVVSFCDVFLRHTKARTVLCIMPINTLQNWLAEFNLWLPDKDTQNNPLAVHGEVRPREFPLHVLNDSHKSMTARCKVIQEWGRDGGVLLIGYELYRQLSLKRAHKTKKKRKKSLDVVDIDEDDKNKALLDEIHSALVKPGPDLVICDEGHRIKNSHASISQALKQIRSKRRVVLTGYPLQNNLLEYWCMVDFVRPNYLGTKAEFCNMFERPIQNGQCIDSTPQDIRLMRYRAHVLHSLLEGFVQRRSHSVLQVSLPQKEEYVLLLRMNAFQRKLYDTFMNEVVRTKAVPNPLKAFAVCCKIWNHPDVLYYFLKKRAGGDDVDLDIEEATGTSMPSTSVPVPGSGSPRGVATKRGRGRGARAGQPSKKEKKAFGLQAGSSGNKPAATIVPNNTNVNSDSSGLPGSSNNGSRMGHNSHGQISGTGGATSQMHNQMPQQQNQGFNIMHQNQSYNGNQNGYHNMPYHQNAVQGSNQGYGSQGSYSSSSYSHNSGNTSFPGLDTRGFGGSNHASGYGESNNQGTPTYPGSSGQVYYSTSNSSNQQGEYNSYYTSAPNQQQSSEGTYSCNTQNSSNYWQNNTSFYQQNMHPQNNATANSNENQYYSSSNNSSSGTPYNNNESYYMNQHQNQSQGYSGQINSNVYQNVNSENNFLDEMGHLHGSHNSQNQLGGSPNSVSGTQTGHMTNTPTLINSNFSGQIGSAGGNLQHNQSNNNQLNSSNQISGSQNTTGNSDQLHNTQVSTCQLGNQNSRENNGQASNLGQIMNSQNPLSSSCHMSNQSHMGNSTLYGNINNAPNTNNHQGNSNQISGPQNHMNNQTGSSQNQQPSSQSQVGNFSHLTSSQTPVGNSSSTIPHSQLSNSNQSPDNHVSTNQSQLGNLNPTVSSPNQIIGKKQMISINQIRSPPNQIGSPHQMGNSSNQILSNNQIGNSPSQIMGKNQMTPPKQTVNDNQMALNQMGSSLNQSLSNNQMGSSNHTGTISNQMSTSQIQMNMSSSQMLGNNQVNMSQNQIMGDNQLSNSRNQIIGNNQRIINNQMNTSPNQMTSDNQMNSSPNQMMSNNQMNMSQNQMIGNNQLSTSQNQIMGNNQMNTSVNQVGSSNQIGTLSNQMSTSQNQMNMSSNQMIGSSNMSTPPNQMNSPQNQIVDSNQINSSTNQMIGNHISMSHNPIISNNQVNSSQNQLIGNSQVNTSQNQMIGNHMNSSHNQMIGNNQLSASQNQMIGNSQMNTSQNQMINNNQVSSTSPSQMIGNNQMCTSSEHMISINQVVGNNQLGVSANQIVNNNQASISQNQVVGTDQISSLPNQTVSINQMGTPSNQIPSNNQIGVPQSQLVCSNQTSTSSSQVVSNQTGASLNQMVGENQMGAPMNEMVGGNQMASTNQISASQNQVINNNHANSSSNQIACNNQVVDSNQVVASPNHMVSNERIGTSPNKLVGSNHINNSSHQLATPPIQMVSNNQMIIPHSHTGNSQPHVVASTHINPNQVGNPGSQNSNLGGSSQSNFSDLNQIITSQNQISNSHIQKCNIEPMSSIQNEVCQSNQIAGPGFSDNRPVDSHSHLLKSDLASHTYNQAGSPKQNSTPQIQGINHNDLPNTQNTTSDSKLLSESQNLATGSAQIPSCNSRINFTHNAGSQNQLSDITQVVDSQNLINNMNEAVNSRSQSNSNQIPNPHGQIRGNNKIISPANQVCDSSQLSNSRNQVGDVHQITSGNQLQSFDQLRDCHNQLSDFSDIVGSHKETENSKNQASNLNQMCSSESQTSECSHVSVTTSNANNPNQRNSLGERCSLTLVSNSESHASNNENHISTLQNQLNHSQNQISIPGSDVIKPGCLNPQNEQCGLSAAGSKNNVGNQNLVSSLQNEINNLNQETTIQTERHEHDPASNSQNQLNNLNHTSSFEISINSHNQADNSCQTINSQIASSGNQLSNQTQVPNTHNHISKSNQFISSYCDGSDQSDQSSNSKNHVSRSQNSSSCEAMGDSVAVSQNKASDCNQPTSPQDQASDIHSSIAQSQFSNTGQITVQNSDASNHMGNQISNVQNQTNNFNQTANSSSNFNSPNEMSCSQNQPVNANQMLNTANQRHGPGESLNTSNDTCISSEAPSSETQSSNHTHTISFQNQMDSCSQVTKLQNQVGGVGQNENLHSVSDPNLIESSQNQIRNSNQTVNLQSQASEGNSTTSPPHMKPTDQSDVSNIGDKLQERMDVSNERSSLNATHDIDPQSIISKSSSNGNVDQVMSSNTQTSMGCSEQGFHNKTMSSHKLTSTCSQVSGTCQEKQCTADLHARMQDMHSTGVNNFPNPLVNIRNSVGSDKTISVGSLNQISTDSVAGKLDSMGITFTCQNETSQTGLAVKGQSTSYLGQFGHSGVLGNSSHSRCSDYNAVNQSYSHSEIKLESDSNPPKCDDSLRNMGAMYAHFSGREIQEGMNQWSSNNYTSESRLPLQKEGSDVQKDDDVKLGNSIASESNKFSSEAAQQFDSQMSFKGNPFTECISMKVENSDKKTDVPHETFLSCKVSNVKSCSESSVASTKTELSKCGDIAPSYGKTESNEPGSDFKERTSFGASNLLTQPLNENSPKSENNPIGNEQREVSLQDSKCVETDCSLNKSVSIGTDANEEDCKDVGCGTASDNFRTGMDNRQFADLGTNTSRAFMKEELGIPYDWATELLKDYVPGNIENSAKMVVFFCILEESMALGDRILVFSQSLFTLNLIEDFLQRTNLPGRQEKWARNWNYYRLDGSTSALEREKLINEYNSNPNIHLFLVSTRAGSLGINLVGANRVVVFDASWNPCHDTQAVCRVYRYGQKKPCFVYRLVMDNCLEKKIYDRQINKQGMADRVVDECNPDAHLSIKEVTNLCWDNEEETEVRDFSKEKDKYIDVVMQKVLDKYSSLLSKEPFQHESLLVDRKEKKLSQAEKRLAKRSYELEKQANINYNRPQYTYYPSPGVGNSGVQTGLQIRAIRTDGVGGNVMPKPVASVRPMQAELNSQIERGPRSTVSTVNTGRSRWIPADVWQRQGMSAQEMTLPLDVVIPTNSPDRASIVLKAGQRVMVLKSPKGIYMQLENGKIIAIRTAFKVGGAGKGAAAQDYKATAALNADKADMESKLADIKKEANILPPNRCNTKISSVLPLKNNSAITITPKNNPVSNLSRPAPSMNKVVRTPVSTMKQELNMKPWGNTVGGLGRSKSLSNKTMQQPTAEAKPYFHHQNQMGRLSSEFYRVGGGMGNQPTAMAKPYFHHEAEPREPRSTHSSLSDDTSSGTENMTTAGLLHDEKDNSSLGDSEMLLKSPIPSPDYTAIVHRREEAEHDSGMSYEDLPHHQEKNEHGYSHGMEENNRFPSKSSSFHSEASNWQTSCEQMINRRNFQGISMQTEDNKALPVNVMNDRNFQVFPEKQMNTDHRNFQLSDFGRAHEASREQQMDNSGCNPVRCPEGTSEMGHQDVKQASHFFTKDPLNSSPSDKGNQKLYHQTFSNTHTQVINDHNQKMDDSVRNAEKSSISSVGCSVKSHHFPDQLKSSANFQSNLESNTNTFIGYERSHASTSQGSQNVAHQTKVQQQKNLIQNYGDATTTHNAMEEYSGESKSKCGGSGESHYEFETGRNNNDMDLSTMSNQPPPMNQSYHTSLSSQTPSNPQMSPSPMTPSKKGRPAKLQTSGSNRVSGEYSDRYEGEHQHMKPFQRTNSQSMDQPNPPTSTAASFGQNINLSSENSQIGQSKSHISNYQQVDNSKTTGQENTEHSQYVGSSYGQYIGGPSSSYYSFSQQGPGSMVQFGNSYYGENQYDRPVDSHDQLHQNTPEKSAPQNVGRTRNQQASTVLPHKKDSTPMNTSESKEPKQDSKPLPASVREDARNVTSPGSTSGSRSGNNSARSTPAGVSQTASSAESSVNYTAPLSSVASNSTSSNFSPYPPGNSSGSLPAHQNPYESMVLNSYSPGTCQYNLPGSNTPASANPFSPAATNYGNPLRPTGTGNAVPQYGAPSAYGNSVGYSASAANQYDSDYARASMYSAFHRPEPHHFAPGPADLGSPFLASMAPPTNPAPFGLTSHRSPHFPSSSSPTAQNPNYYPQNMYAPSPYAARPGYAGPDPAYGVPYGTPGATSFNPFLNHLHQHPYTSLQHPGTSASTPSQSSNSSPQ